MVVVVVVTVVDHLNRSREIVLVVVGVEVRNDVLNQFMKSLECQTIWILSLGNVQPLRIFVQGSKMATLSRVNLGWSMEKE